MSRRRETTPRPALQQHIAGKPLAADECQRLASRRPVSSATESSQDMYKSVLVAASLSGMLLAAVPSPATAAPESAAESNVGFVIYTKTLSPGTLSARWMFSTRYKGPGIATGGPKTGYAGRYHVRYFYDSGEFSDAYDLLIEKTDDVYKVSWIVKGKVEATGVGMEVDNGLAVG